MDCGEDLKGLRHSLVSVRYNSSTVYLLVALLDLFADTARFDPIVNDIYRRKCLSLDWSTQNNKPLANIPYLDLCSLSFIQTPCMVIAMKPKQVDTLISPPSIMVQCLYSQAQRRTPKTEIRQQLLFRYE